MRVDEMKTQIISQKGERHTLRTLGKWYLFDIPCKNMAQGHFIVRALHRLKPMQDRNKKS